MEVPKQLVRARRRMLAAGPRSGAVQRSLIETLDRQARLSPDDRRASEAAHALAVLRDGGWSDSAWSALGVPARVHFARSRALTGFDRRLVGA